MSDIPSPPPPPSAPVEEPDRRVGAPGWTAGDLGLVFGLSVGFGVFAIAALFIAFGAAGLRFSEVTTVGIASVVIYGAVLVSGWLLVLKRRRIAAGEVGFKWVGIGPVLLAVPMVIGVMIVTAIILTLVQMLVGGVPSVREQVAPGGDSLRGVDLAWLLLAGSLAAPIAEEFFFRGLLYRYLRARRGVTSAVLLSSALFAVFHFIPPLMPALFVFGIVLALLVERFDSLYPSILLHALNNGGVMVAVYLTQT